VTDAATLEVTRAPRSSRQQLETALRSSGRIAPPPLATSMSSCASTSGCTRASFERDADDVGGGQQEVREMGAEVAGSPLLAAWRDLIADGGTPGCYPVALAVTSRHTTFRRATHSSCISTASRR